MRFRFVVLLIVSVISYVLMPFFISAAYAEPYKLVPSIPELKTIEHDSGLFNEVISCYPAPSLFDMDLKLQAGVRHQSASDYYEQTEGWKTNAYTGLVLSVPLYSTSERYRALHEESKRREQLAKDIAVLDKAIAAKVKALDMYQLYKALEMRSIQRVKDGYAPLDEQITYIEKGATYYESFINAQADIAASIGDIVSFCTADKRQRIEALLTAHVEKGLALYEVDQP